MTYRMGPLAFVLSIPIRAYRLFGSPWVGRNCRFLQTCSEYALVALSYTAAARAHG